MVGRVVLFDGGGKQQNERLFYSMQGQKAAISTLLEKGKPGWYIQIRLYLRRVPRISKKVDSY